MEAARPGSKLATLAWSAGIAAAVVAAFSPAFGAGFLLWDDSRNLLEHDAWRGLSPGHLRWMATTCHGGPYQPLSWLSLALDHAAFGLDPRGYHATNVALHAIAAVLFFLAAARLLPLAGAAAAALFFALHPLRVESVAWVTERRDVLSGVFFCAALLAYLRSARRLSLVFFLASLLAKASGLALPLVLLLLDRWPLRRPFRRSALDALPFALVALPFAAVALWGQATQTGAMRSLAEQGVAARLAQAAYAVVFYPAKTLLPLDLTPIHELPSPFDPAELRFVLAAIAAVAGSATLFALRRRAPAAWTAWAAYLALLAPVSGIAGVGPQLVADRYSYFACLPFALLAAGALFRYAPRVATAVALAVACVLGAATWRQTAYWRDTETLFRRALDVDPSSPVAHDLVGRALAERGLRAEAAGHYRAAIELAPERSIPRNNLGLLLLEEGRVEEAIAEFRRALEASPDYARARSHLGVALFRAGRAEEAERELREGVRRNPRDAGTRTNLGVLLAATGRLEEAATELEAAVALDPASREARAGLEGVRRKLGR